jgi:hypothetical protein
MKEKITNLTLNLSQRAVKNWMAQQGLKHTAMNGDALLSLIEDSIKGEHLSLDRFQEGVREIEEHGGKMIYLKQLATKSKPKNFETLQKHLETVGIDLTPKLGPIKKSNGGPKLDYAIWKDGEIRIRFSELHKDIKVSKKNRDFSDQFVQKFIVFSLEPEIGFLKILIDPPGEEHTHTDDKDRISSNEYFQYYFNRAIEAFGPIETFEIGERVAKLLEATPVLYVPRAKKGWTVDNFRFSLSGKGDIRTSEQYANADDATSEYVNGHWVKAQSNGQLTRDFFMPLYPTEGKLSVWADCLAQEVNYAISRIREF